MCNQGEGQEKQKPPWGEVIPWTLQLPQILINNLFTKYTLLCNICMV